MRPLAVGALLAIAAGDCPNACSGHGDCDGFGGDKTNYGSWGDASCDCYHNYQGNDCSQRTCYFGIAHVDTPKGDLDSDGFVDMTVSALYSEVYPRGTTEQYPDADADEGHFYM